MKFLAALFVCLLAVSPAAASHGEPFPLPLKHSVIAQQAQNLDGKVVDACGRGEVLVASFDEGGYHWLYIYAIESEVGVFVQYTPGVSEPLRAWFFHGTQDDVVITMHVDDPVKEFANVCVALYPNGV